MKIVAATSFFKSLKKIGSLGSKFRKAIYWLKIHTRKRFLRIVKTAFSGYPYDYAYLLELEQAKLNEIADYLEESDRFVGVEFAVRDIRICCNLIDIFTGKRDLFHYDGGLKFVESDEKDENGEPLMELNGNDLKYSCEVKVNIKNASRFVKDEKFIKFYTEHPHELYELKARYLYHKIRYEKEQEWWD